MPPSADDVTAAILVPLPEEAMLCQSTLYGDSVNDQYLPGGEYCEACARMMPKEESDDVAATTSVPLLDVAMAVQLLLRGTELLKIDDVDHEYPVRNEAEGAGTVQVYSVSK